MTNLNEQVLSSPQKTINILPATAPNSFIAEGIDSTPTPIVIYTCRLVKS